MKRTREGFQSDGKPSGFVAILRERAKPFPEWSEITEYFAGNLNIGPYRTLAKRYGCMLRRKSNRVYCCIAPFAVPTAVPTAQKDNT